MADRHDWNVEIYSDRLFVRRWTPGKVTARRWLRKHTYNQDVLATVAEFPVGIHSIVIDKQPGKPDRLTLTLTDHTTITSEC